MEEKIIPRVVEGSEEAEIVAMAMMLYAIPSVYCSVEAIGVMPGMGEHWRITEAIKAYESFDPHGDARDLLVAGGYQGEVTALVMSPERLRLQPFNLERRDGTVRVQPEARNTVEQVDWLIGEIKELDIKSLAL